nr:peptidoglycan-binding domain-containing protein [Kroppenstedtia eburnea]
MLVQNRLRAAGYYRGECDGIFGRDLEQAVKKYQREHRLEVSGQIRMAEYLNLGLVE